MDTRNTFVVFIIGIVVIPMTSLRRTSSMEIEDKCKVVKSVLQQYQTQCVFFFKPEELQDWNMETELLSFKYFTEFSRNFYLSSMIHDKWKSPISREVCQPFVFAFSNISRLDAILEIFANSTYRANAKFIVFEDSSPSQDSFNNTYIPLDTEFLLARQLDKKDMSIDEFYHILPNTSLLAQTVGQWNSENGLNWTNKSYSQRRNNFQGTELKAVFYPFGKQLYIIENKDSKTIKFGGYNYQIWKTLQNELNFTSNLHRVTEGGFGVRNATGSWNGVTGLLQRKDVHVSFITLVMSKSRLATFDYFIPVIRTRDVIYLKRPEAEEYMLEQVLKPLSGHLWIGVGLVMILISILLTITWLTSGRICYQNTKAKYSLSDSIFCVFGIFCQAGAEDVPNVWSIRLVIISACVIGYIVYLAYSAMLFSFLAVRKYEMPFNNLKELIDDGRYKLGLIENTADFLFFKETNDPLLKEAYRKLVLAEPNHPTSAQEGLRRICDQKRFAHMVLKVNERHLSADLDLRCSYVTLPRFSFSISLGFGCTKNSPLKRVFNYYILKMSENGLLKIYDDRLVPLKFRDKAQEDDAMTVATLEKVTTIFFVIFAGIILSNALLLVEISYHRCKFSAH
ncbi:Ionotropic receptor 157 [Blattella germanica]|nr:Ionotropic receptor 157 [Blattella germanica]